MQPLVWPRGERSGFIVGGAIAVIGKPVLEKKHVWFMDAHVYNEAMNFSYSSLTVR